MMHNARSRLMRVIAAAGVRFVGAKTGNVAIIFAVAMIPMAFATLGVLQYGIAISDRTKLNAIADSAALQAVSHSAVVTYASTSTTGATQATAMFNTQASQLSGVTINSLNVTITPTPATINQAGSLKATVSYSATVPTITSGLLGTTFTQISGTATAQASVPAYTDFYLLLDDSPSMGIGATPTDIAAMQAANNCAFACHAADALDQSKYPGYSLPSVPGTQLRIDALRNATSALISTAIAQQSIPNQFRIGIYTFANTVTQVGALSSNLSQVQSANAAIALPTQDVGTQIGDAVDWLNSNVVTAAGTGTQSTPFKFVFLVTDGAEDHAFNFTPGNYDTLISPVGTFNGVAYGSVINSAACQGLKNKGVTVAVLYTNYAPLNDTRYNQMVAPFANNIIPALQACASPNFFFQANFASDINNAMQMMFAAALQKTARLSQ